MIALCPAIISITAAVDPAAPSSNPVAAAAQFLFMLLFVRCYWIGSVVATGLHLAHPLVLLAEQLLTVAATVGSIGPSCRSQFMKHPLTVAKLDVAYVYLQPLTLFCQPLLAAGGWSRGGRTAVDRCAAGEDAFLCGRWVGESAGAHLQLAHCSERPLLCLHCVLCSALDMHSVGSNSCGSAVAGGAAAQLPTAEIAAGAAAASSGPSGKHTPRARYGGCM